MDKIKLKVISIDSACTIFWDPGCDPKLPWRPVEKVFHEINNFLNNLGYNVKEYSSYRSLYWSLWEELWKHGPQRELWHRYVLAKYLYKIGVKADHNLLDRIYGLFIELRAKWFTMPSNHRWILEQLRGRGYRIILTTGTGAHDLVLKILEVNDATHLFDFVFSTQLVGIPKNDPRFYMELLDLLNIEANMIIHIGDSIKYDIEPAKKAGLPTIYYGWRSQCRATDPQPCIKDLSELIHLL